MSPVPLSAYVSYTMASRGDRVPGAPPSLEAKALSYFVAGLSSNTRRTYDAVVRNYTRFCASLDLDVAFPASPAVCCLWLAHLADSITASSVVVYSQALHSVHVDAGLTSPLASPVVSRTIKGIKRVLGLGVAQPRFPLTPEVLVRLEKFTLDDEERFALDIGKVACGGLLRIGELLPLQSTSTGPLLGHVTRFSSAGGSTYFELFLPESKTDQYKKGVTVLIASGFAVAALDRIITRHPTRSPSDPLLMRSVVPPRPYLRKPVLARFNDLLARARVDRSGFTGVSFRSGGATALANKGVPTLLIQVLGRWTSDCYKRYVHLSDDDLRLALAKL